MHTFKQLGLSAELVQALSEQGITEPTSIQLEAIPQLLEGPTDFLGLAQTGTGKTAAFGLPLIDLVNPADQNIQAVIMSPTRELAQQIQKALQEFARHKAKININVVYGGAAITNQIKDLRRDKPQILVATPGRLLDLINRKVVKLDQAKFVILDEADEMLNMGFKEDIDKILDFSHEGKNTWLFSATMPREIQDIVHRYMNNPKEVRVKTEERVNQNIDHQYVLVKRRDKVEALQRIIDASGDIYAVVFCRTKNDTQTLAGSMSDAGYSMEPLNGDMSQAQRDAVMRRFKSGHTRLLCATDVAARGIDVDNLTHVIHYDLPDELAFYTHRSGRTARAGKKGIAISLIAPEAVYKAEQLERRLDIKMQRVRIPLSEEVIMQKIQSRVDQLLQTEVSKEVENWMPAFEEQFKELSKEDLIRLIVAQNMSGMKAAGRDLNAEPGSRRSRGDAFSGKGRKGRNDRGPREDRGPRGDRGDRGSKPFPRRERSDSNTVEEGMKRFSINVGKGDNLQKGDLLKMLCDASGVRSKHIGRIHMEREQTYVDVKEARSTGFEKAFEGLKFEGRKVRVKRER